MELGSLKINGLVVGLAYLMQKLLPDIEEISDYFSVQQKKAHAHISFTTEALNKMKRSNRRSAKASENKLYAAIAVASKFETGNSPDLNGDDAKINGALLQWVYSTKIDSNHSKQAGSIGV